jgi:hypothetical protein
MALFKSLVAQGTKPVQTPNDGLIARLLYEYTTEDDLAAGDIIDLGPLPANLDPKDVMLASEDLDADGSPTITLSVGLLNSGKTDLNGGTNETWITASTVGQAGGIVRATTAAVAMMGSSTSERRLGIKVVAGAATGAGAGKKIAVLLDVQP